MAKKEAKKEEPADLGQEQVQATVDAENEQGFRGTKVDPTPNENYTVSGVTSGAPTPETDAAAAREASAASGVGLHSSELNEKEMEALRATGAEKAKARERETMGGEE